VLEGDRSIALDAAVMAIALATPRSGYQREVMVASLPPPPRDKSTFLISEALQTNLGSIEFFLSHLGHLHRRLKKVAAARRLSSGAARARLPPRARPPAILA
jgi:hypothetical protein